MSEPTPLPLPDRDLLRMSPLVRLLERRMVFLRGPLQETTASDMVAQLLLLDAESADDVTMYIDCPGGSATDMFAIHDVVQLMRARVHTRCVGLAASAGAILLATGSGTRSATPNARIMIHQPSGGAQGTAEDIQIQAAQSAYLRRRVEEVLAKRTGQPIERIAQDTTRDFWLSAAEARDYGLIDEVASPAAAALQV
jgi:ATP-dependent Clp protease, protease subunit